MKKNLNILLQYFGRSTFAVFFLLFLLIFLPEERIPKSILWIACSLGFLKSVGIFWEEYQHYRHNQAQKAYLSTPRGQIEIKDRELSNQIKLNANRLRVIRQNEERIRQQKDNIPNISQMSYMRAEEHLQRAVIARKVLYTWGRLLAEQRRQLHSRLMEIELNQTIDQADQQLHILLNNLPALHDLTRDIRFGLSYDWADMANLASSLEEALDEVNLQLAVRSLRDASHRILSGRDGSVNEKKEEIGELLDELELDLEKLEVLQTW